jgi:hypothetical protein
LDDRSDLERVVTAHPEAARLVRHAYARRASVGTPTGTLFAAIAEALDAPSQSPHPLLVKALRQGPEAARRAIPLWLALARRDDFLPGLAAVFRALARAVSAADDLAIDLELQDMLDDAVT